MNEYFMKNKVYVKSKNSIKKIYDSYTISLIIFILLTIVINLIIKNNDLVVSLLKSILISLVVTSILSYFINLLKKEKGYIKIYTEDNAHIIALIIALFAIDTKIYILIIAIVISLLVKNTIKNINLSGVLYGILFIILFKYFTDDLSTPLIKVHEAKYLLTYNEILMIGGGLKNYLFGLIYLSPILSIGSFIYLFHKRAIKYNLVFSYVLTVFIIMITIGLFNNFNIWFGFFQLNTGNLLFLTIYTLTDYIASPTIKEGQILYGIILGIISVILRFIIPELAIILTFILGELLIFKPIEKISPKLKYNKKGYNTMISICCVISLITILVITIII